MLRVTESAQRRSSEKNSLLNVSFSCVIQFLLLICFSIIKWPSKSCVYPAAFSHFLHRKTPIIAHCSFFHWIFFAMVSSVYCCYGFLAALFFPPSLKLSMKNDFELYLISCAHIYSHPSHSRTVFIVIHRSNGVSSWTEENFSAYWKNSSNFKPNF